MSTARAIGLFFKLGLLVAAIVAFAVLLHQRDSALLQVERLGRAAEVTRLRYENAVAQVKADAEKRAQLAEARAEALRKDVDHENTVALAAARTRADDYARSHRVFADAAPEAARGDSGIVDLSAAGFAPFSPDRSGDGAFVAISRSDYDACTENTVRLLSGRAWALRRAGVLPAPPVRP